MDVSKYKTDRGKATEGVWVPVEHDSDGNLLARILVAKANNHRYQEYLRTLSKPYQRQITAGVADENLLVELLRKAKARYMLLGWEGLQRDGEDIEYSAAEAEELLKMEYFADLVDVASNDMALFLEDSDRVDAELLKNE